MVKIDKNKIDYLVKEINNIKANINNDSVETILDSYEISELCYNFIISKDNLWFKFFFKNIEMSLKESELSIVFNELKLYDNKNKSYQSFVNYIENEFTKFDIIDELGKIPKEDINSDNTDSEDELGIEIAKEELMNDAKFEGLRNNQKLARESNIKQKFVSGIHNQVTGSGKSIIMMLTINDHNSELKKNNTSNKGKLYIITCPRIEVLNKMFFELETIVDEENDINMKQWILNKDNKKFWKDNDIIDLDKFRIIDRVNKKTRTEFKLSKSKPNILVINTDYFRVLNEKNIINYKKVNLIIFDECHGVSASKFYELLENIKFTHKKHIIGFSATPVRDNAEEKVKSIFSSSLKRDADHTLNIISNYDMMNAICDNIVLPPSYTIVEIKRTCKKKIGKSNKDITEKIIQNKISELPYKKLICWCGTITKMKEWYLFFKNKFPQLKLYCSTSKDKEHSNFNTDFDKFCKEDNNAILLCVNRCREGSDIKNLDCGIYIDHVKKRGILVSIQTVGRILRPDKDNKKKCGYIIDTFINDGKIEIEIMTADKVLNYYKKVLNLSCEESYKGIIENYEKMRKICNNTEFDDKTNKIKIHIDDNKNHDTEIQLDLITRIFDWTKFKNKLDKIIDHKFNISKEDKFKIIIDKLKKTKKFEPEKNFWNSYDELDKKGLDLPDNLYDEYKEFFDNESWFELLDMDISSYYKTKSECFNAIKELNKFNDGILTDKTYDDLRKIDKKLPPYPMEYFKKMEFTSVNNEFNLKTQNLKVKV